MAEVGLHLRVGIIVRIALSEQEFPTTGEQPPFLWSHELDQLCIAIHYRSHHLFPVCLVPRSVLRILRELVDWFCGVLCSGDVLQMVVQGAQARPVGKPLALVDLGEESLIFVQTAKFILNLVVVTAKIGGNLPVWG